MKNAILIVDDSRLNRETLADILKDKYNIIEAEDGRSGLEVLEKRKDDIVLVILDIVMPGMDGFAFMEEARTRESIRNIPIVVATTENDYQTEKKIQKMGCLGIIKKISNLSKKQHLIKQFLWEKQLILLLEDHFQIEKQLLLLKVVWMMNALKLEMI